MVLVRVMWCVHEHLRSMMDQALRMDCSKAHDPSAHVLPCFRVAGCDWVTEAGMLASVQRDV
eukprot:scaffold7331_cov403-Prasinococcus_capsulatus_cf.AAC.6